MVYQIPCGVLLYRDPGLSDPPCGPSWCPTRDHCLSDPPESYNLTALKVQTMPVLSSASSHDCFSFCTTGFPGEVLSEGIVLTVQVLLSGEDKSVWGYTNDLCMTSRMTSEPHVPDLLASQTDLQRVGSLACSNEQH